ncbi:MAG TPA: MalY/PatB family protein [Candidatus Cloacimonadota bacterium]|nr:MalY/PatB family protein [Candidatus Cloacimonadota bacterium]HPT71764.1 MalY/PatB family protein [Candidatus Cloacimonadota bacterium]
MPYDFDTVYSRKDTGCYKYDALKVFLGSEDLIPMWVADMDFTTAPEILAALQVRLDHQIFGYNFRKSDFYDSLIEWVKKRHGWTIHRNWIIHTPGIVPALALAVSAFTEPGDGILIQQPVYHPFSEIVTDHGRKLIVNQLIENDLKYTMDLDTLDRQLAEAKLVFLCSPHNPVGRVWTQDELLDFGRLCRKHKVIVIADEIHSDLIFAPHKHIPFASLEDFSEFTLTCYAPSKTFNIAGLATSAIVAENRLLYDTFHNLVFKRHLHYGNTFGLTAFETAYRSGEAWLKELLIYLNDSLQYIKEYMKMNIPQIKVCEPESTFLLWLDFRQLGISDDDLQKLMLKKAKIAFDQGTHFGLGGNGFMRMNYAFPRSILTQALHQLKQALSNHLQG